MDPVGVAHTTPSHSQRDRGRPSTSTMRSSIRSSGAFSIETSLSAQVWATSTPPSRIRASTVIRTLDQVVLGDHRVDDLLQVLALELGEEPDMPEVHAQQRHARPAGTLRSPQHGAVPTQDDHQLAAVVHGPVRAGVDREHAGQVEDRPFVAGRDDANAPVQQRLGRLPGGGHSLGATRVE